VNWEFGIRVSRAAIDAVLAHARETAPAECCGLLLGRATNIVEAVRTRNVADHPSRFTIDPKDHIDGRRDARRRGLEVVGFYHSHPRSPSTPSETDRVEADYREHLHMIVSLLADPADVGLYRFDGGNFLPVPFVTVA
jgi:proteasome lid subunit RPN8/RPN11